MDDHFEPSPLLQPTSHSRPGYVRRFFLGDRGLRTGWRLLVFLLIFIGVQYILDKTLVHWLVSVGLVHPIVDGVLTPAVVLAEDGVVVISLLVAMGIMGRIEGRALGVYGLPTYGAFRKEFWLGTLWGTMAVSAIALGIFAAHHYFFGGLAISGWQIVEYAAGWAGLTCLASLAEELTFRGYAQFTLTEGIGFWPATLLTSVAFAVSHMENPGNAWPGVVAVFLFGVFQCLTLRRRGTLWFAVGMHTGFNYGEAFIYSVKDSGYRIQGHLLDSELNGPKWLTGGSFGPEGSVITLGVVVILMIAFYLFFQDKSLRGTLPKA